MMKSKLGRHIYTMEYYSAIRRNETELFVVRWMDLEFVIQSEVSQKDKNIWNLKKEKKKGSEELRGRRGIKRALD